MSDDEPMTGEELREHVARVRADYERSADDGLGSLIATAEESIRLGAMRACGGDRDGIARCTPEVLASCEWREAPSCPRRIVEWEQQQAAEKQRARLISSSVPDGLIPIALAPSESESVRVVREWLASGMRTLVLSGGVGIGKSTAASVGIALSSGSAFYLHATRFSSVKLLDSDEWPRVLSTELLVLDDVGLEHQGATNWAANQIQSLLCDRHDRAKRTIVTCNLDDKQFAAYGERMVDRMRQYGRFVRVGGRSLRVRK